MLVVSGEEYAKMPFQILLDKLEEAIRSGPRVIAEFEDSEGNTRLFTVDDDGGVALSDGDDEV